MQKVPAFGKSNVARRGNVARSGSSSPRTIFWLLCVISFLNYMDRYVLSGSVNTVAHELHFSLDGVGYLSSAFLIVYTVFTLPLSIWADRANRKDVIALSVAVWSVATAATALAGNYLTLFISRMVLGIGEAGYFPAGTALLSDCYSREKRSQVMGRWSGAQYIGILAGFGLGGALAGLFTGSWRIAFLLTGIPGLIVAFLVWRIREPRRNQADEEAGGNLASADFADPGAVESALIQTQVPRIPFWTLCKQVMRIKSVIVITFMQIFSFFVFSVCVTFLPTYLQQKDTLHLSSGLAGIYSGGVVVIGGLIGTLCSGYLADYLERFHSGSRILTSGIVLMVSAPLLAVSLSTHNIYIFTPLFMIIAGLLCAFNGPSTAALQDIVPYWLRSSAIGITLMIGHLFGDAVSPTIVGILATDFDPTHGSHFATGMAGHDLALAIIYTCVPAIFIAGLIGVFGARYMHQDVVDAENAKPPVLIGENVTV
ncbi:MFS transporter [Ktedonobacteria bacterium brp13]|nr:MFS transporter [Ktedonobacteria bacterium brp13]